MATLQFLFLALAISQVTSFWTRGYKKRFLAELRRDPTTDDLKFYVGRTKADVDCEDCTYTVEVFDKDEKLIKTLDPMTWKDIDAEGSFIRILKEDVPPTEDLIIQVTSSSTGKCNAYDVPKRDTTDRMVEKVDFVHRDECIKPEKTVDERDLLLAVLQKLVSRA